MALKFNPQTNQWEDDQNVLASNKLGGQSYPLSPMDLQGDTFGALKGVLPDANTVVHTDQQYPNSPMGQEYEMPNLLASLLSPQGIQRPLYNYTQSKEANQALGAEMALPAALRQAEAPRQLASIAQAQTEIKPIGKSDKKPSEAKPSSPLEMAQQEAPKENKQETPQSSMLDELLKAQQNKDDNSRAFAMLQAADRIGNAMAGQGYLGYDASRLDYLKPILASGLENVKEKQKFIGEQQDQTLKGLNIDKAKLQMDDEKAKSDPNSDISKMTRASVVDSLNKIGRADLAKMASNPKLSSRQLEDTFGQYNLNNMIQAFDAQQNRLELAKMRQEDKNTIKQEKAEKVKDDFITQRYDKIIQSKNYQTMSKLAQSKRLIDDAFKSPSGIKDIGALYSLIKMFDPESVVKEGELKLTDSAKSLWTRANTALSKAGSNPRLLDKNTLNLIKKAADEIYKESQQQYKMQVKPIMDQAKKRGIKDDELSMIDPLHDQMKELDMQPQIQYNVDQDALSAEMKKRGL